jgi:hypothetical protein
VPRDGAWQVEGDRLTSSGWRAASAHRFDGLGVRLPATAGGVFDVGVSRVERLQLHVTLAGASPVPAQVDHGRVVYAGAWPSSDAIVVASDTTFEQLVLLHDPGAPTELAWTITLPAGITGARDDGRGGLLWLDAAGQAELHTPRPFVLDASGAKIDADVQLAQGRLVVAYDASGVTFPALLDPAIESAFWEQEHPAVEPPARYQAAMAFDSTRAVSVLFGGTSPTDLGDTWEWNGTTWAQQCKAAPCSTTTPSARPGAAMSFDAVTGVSVLFGGGDSGKEQNDTWSWNGTAWTPLCPTAPCMPPTARTQATMAFYGTTGVAVLFGGSVSSACGTTYDGDTWTWNDTLWQPASPTTSPPARAGAGMVYDTARDVALLFGGSGNFPDLNLGDTWAWNGTKTTWSPLCAQAPCAGPPARNDLGMAFDAVPGNTVMFGGNTGNPQLDDTWQWNGTSWTQMGGPAGPGARDQVAMAYDAARARVVMFGGSAGGTALAETWEYHSHGAACTADTQCDTGHCVDGVCCESVCGTCQSCDQAASLQPGTPPPGPVATPGICSPVTNGPDSDSCTGGMTCNAEGQCKEAPGRTCSVPTDCASGSCVDGCCDGVTPCIPADAGADAPSGNEADAGATAAPGGKGGAGCGCRAAGEGGAGGRSPAGPFAALGLALGMVARLARSRRARTRLGVGIVVASTVTVGVVAASCSLVTPLDQLSAQWPPDASVGVAKDAAAEQDSAPEAGQDAAPEASGTPPSNPALWSDRFGDSQDQYVYAVATSSAGNILIAGAFAGSIDFGGGYALASTGGKNAFVAMLDSTGHAQWARSFGDAPDGGSYDKLAFGAAIDGAGESFVCGEFAGSLVAGSTTLLSAGGFDAFVVKLNPMGTVLWAQALSGPGDQAALGIAVDSPGNSVVEGSFEDTLTVSSTTLVSRGGFDGFTARFESNGSGSLSWVIPFGGVADQIGTGVVLTDAGTTVATGYFAGPANVGTDLEAGVITSAGGFDVASYELVTTSGATLGASGFGDPSNQYGYAIAADAIGAGHVALAGPFQGSITFGATPVLQSAGLDDIFVAKLGLTGVAQWSTSFGDPEEQIAYGTALDLGGNVVVAGSLQGSATLGTTTVTSAGGNDAVLAKLDPDGKPLWIERFGDPNDQIATAVTTVLQNGQYDVVLVGNFEGQIDLGNGPLQSQGGYDFFVAVFGP